MMAKPILSRAARAEILAIAVQQLGLKTLRRRKVTRWTFTSWRCSRFAMRWKRRI